MNFEEIILFLARERTRKSIPAQELSYRIGKDRSYINKFESGKINISFKTFYEICEALEIEPNISFKQKDN